MKGRSRLYPISIIMMAAFSGSGTGKSSVCSRAKWQLGKS